MGKRVTAAAIMSAIAFSGTAMAQAGMDPHIESAGRCELVKPMTAELAAFRLLQSSRVVAREPLGSLVVYLGALDQKTRVNLFRMNPTRWAVITRAGQSDAMVGALYSADSPISDSAIMASYQGGLKRKVDVVPFSTATLLSSGVERSYLSSAPGKGANHVMLAKLKGGDRLVICAPLEQIQRFVR